MEKYTADFNELDNTLTELVGGKNASLGEMFQQLKSQNINVPDGFATTAEAYWKFLDENNLRGPIKEELANLDREKFSNLKKIGEKIRTKIMEAHMPNDISDAIKKAYQRLQDREENVTSVAVRSSATAEDLPEASFAGQHDSFLNVSGEKDVVETIQLCMASLFTDRAIKYREDNNFDHMQIALSAGVQKMVRSDLSCAGVAFTIDPDSGFEKMIFINGSWGLGDNVVGGVVKGDAFYVYKDGLKKNKYPIVAKQLGPKKKTLVYSEEKDERGQNTVNKETPDKKRNSFILSDDEIIQLGKWCMAIEEHYKKPMDVEWAKDGESNELYIVQARPETVHSSKKDKSKIKHYHLSGKGKVITTGQAIGEKIAAGKARILSSPGESDKLKEGEVLITEITNPDWDPILRKASAIITDSGGRTSHAAIVARELNTVAIVGADNATELIEDGQEITVSCSEGQEGKIYEGKLDWEEEEVDLETLGHTETEVMLILADPKSAFLYGAYPVQGVGLMRLEFVINNSIKVHPMALVKLGELEGEKVKNEIENLITPFDGTEKYFVEKLSMAVGMIAASFYPRDVIVRMSDFKSNEYAQLLGGKQFEPKEENPMLGFRGASRYYSDKYKEGFRLECLAMKRARDEMGLDNIKLMIPFCRTIEEGKKVIEEMKKYGLEQGENGLEIYMMVEIPSNVIGIKYFAEIFDGFSIGSNDLTQLTLGIDRDSELISTIFDERNPQSKAIIASAIRNAREAGRKIGFCGQAPSDFPEFAHFLVEQEIDSISFNPDAVAKGIKNIVEVEKQFTEETHR